jgi:hypothetical protein
MPSFVTASERRPAARREAADNKRKLGDVQELLRHANSRITLDVCTQAVDSNKRAAQSKVVRMMIPGMGQNAGEMDPQKARIGA